MMMVVVVVAAALLTLPWSSHRCLSIARQRLPRT